MQSGVEEPAPTGLFYDGEMRGEPGDLLALAVAFSLSTLEKPEAEIGTLSLTGSSLEGAAFTEAVARFYTLISLRDYPERFQRYRGLAIGLEETDAPPPSPALKPALGKKNAEGEPLYPHEVVELTDTADPAALIRNGLTALEDQAAVIVLNGPATNLAQVLGLNGGRELIEAKVKNLVVALGDPAGAADSHVKADIAAAKKLFAEWPTPIVIVGPEIGAAIPYPSQTLTDGVDWTEDHPLVDAYRAGGNQEGDTRGAAAILHAVRPQGGYFLASNAGKASVDDAGRLSFTPGTGGSHTYLKLDPEQTAHVGELYADLVARMPAARELPDMLKRFIERQKEEEAKEKAEAEAAAKTESQ